MRILLANDDGIDAPGLALLERAAALISDDVWTVAPAAKRTAAGHSLTIARPLTMEKRGERRYACSGTPADCVLTAMTWLFRDEKKPDLVLSGVNDGRNVAEDIAYSGTLGVAREATFWGLPAIGLSRVKKPEVGVGDAEWLQSLILRLWNTRADWQGDRQFLSVNLPSRLPAQLVQPRIGRDKVGIRAEVLSTSGDTTEITIERSRQDTTTPGDENAHLAAGKATVTRLLWSGETPLPAGFVESLG